jgi:hypothetical protein
MWCPYRPGGRSSTLSLWNWCTSSGHLHDLALFHMHNMYSFHNENDLELELIDWKNNRKFRVIAVDQGTLSFTDVMFGDLQVVLPTYPKDTSFMMPGKEEYGEYLRNTIRVLVFSDVPIIRVTIWFLIWIFGPYFLKT